LKALIKPSISIAAKMSYNNQNYNQNYGQNQYNNQFYNPNNSNQAPPPNYGQQSYGQATAPPP